MRLRTIVSILMKPGDQPPANLRLNVWNNKTYFINVGYKHEHMGSCLYLTKNSGNQLLCFQVRSM